MNVAEYGVGRAAAAAEDVVEFESVEGVDVFGTGVDETGTKTA